MTETQIETYVSMLESGLTAHFTYDGCYYEIFESIEEGYVVNVYSSNEKDVNDEYMDHHIIDGGLCTGSAIDAIDAIEFML